MLPTSHKCSVCEVTKPLMKFTWYEDRQVYPVCRMCKSGVRQKRLTLKKHAVRTKRECLKCDKKFISTLNNRLCGFCKEINKGFYLAN